jgi:hypothetical protein
MALTPRWKSKNRSWSEVLSDALHDQTQIALIVVLILLFKHLVCDFFLQTAYQYRNKGIYGHPGGLLHAGLHVLGTACLFFYVNPGMKIAALILAGEFIVHYHIDWAKEQVVKRMGLSMQEPGFWWALGVDQFLHGATYIAIAWFVLGARAAMGS